MKKIKTLFKRDFDRRPVLATNEVNDDCEWVINGEGKATRKYDGCCCMVKDGLFYKRREIKKGKPIPTGFVEADFDEITGKSIGWLLIRKDNPSDKWFIKAVEDIETFKNGTYELLGKGSQGDVENFGEPTLLKHSEAKVFEDCPRTFSKLKEWLKDKNIEGIVWHHEDGRMVKIKKRDFGLKRNKLKGSLKIPISEILKEQTKRIQDKINKEFSGGNNETKK